MSFGFLLENIWAIIYSFARIFALFSIVPIIAADVIPYVLRVLFALVVAILIVPVVSNTWGEPKTFLEFLFILLSEATIGLMMGFVIYGFFSLFQMAGQFFALQMGLSASSVFDPLSQEEIPILGNFFNLAATYLFITTKGLNKLFFTGIYDSFKNLSVANLVNVKENIFDYLTKFIGNILLTSFIIALPVTGCLLLVSIVLGLSAKVAPQMNIFVLGYSINFAVAFLLIIFLMPYMIDMFAYLFTNMFDSLGEIFFSKGVANV